VSHRAQPTVILAKTVKGYGMGEAGEGQNITHQQKKMGEAQLRQPEALAEMSRRLAPQNLSCGAERYTLDIKACPWLVS